ncbi:DegV family protein [Alkaliphilus hydrothermalis]|uniref:DegV family protein with EDD domain n=1 Tax=Alkaliphilus hydrothermalis TaxID=1482730 RepID=A0ABS2NRT3_9FIRM|nr:DegV family protein [Alkaliphilus hydrothermalis]MBM7615482.1 DegV family protein with EDD domain [Alkaliphilus hydrothermalis]
MKIRLVTDSGADLPIEYAKENNIEIVPLQITFEDEVYNDGVDLSTSEFYNKMASTDLLPKTSLPAPQSFLNVFEKFDENDSILCLTISAGLSGTYQSAMIAKDMIKRKIEVIDSLHVSMGTGLQVMKAQELINAGLSFEEIKEQLLELRHTMHSFVAIDNLDNVIKGGRISNWKGSIAKVMQIKPILTMAPDGSLKVVDYCRGRKRQLKKLLEAIEETGKDISQSTLSILHAKASQQDISFMEEGIRKLFNPKEILIGELGATMGSHGGFGALAVLF